MATREDLKGWVVEALAANGGKARVFEVCKHILDSPCTRTRTLGQAVVHMAVRRAVGCSTPTRQRKIEACPWKAFEALGIGIVRPLEPDGSARVRHVVADPRWVWRHVLQYGGEAVVEGKGIALG